MATTEKTPINIVIEDIKIQDWTDASSRDGLIFHPNTMSICASIEGIYVQNIITRYIPISSKDEITKEIIKVLRLDL